MALRAVVIGAGWAGQGHVNALRFAGVEVVAICARERAVTQAVADRLGVPIASTNWRQTLAAVKPEIVTLATPASLRREVVEVATARGCHVLCDKPLAATAAEARELYTLVNQAGVKHAYAATHCYDPSVAWIAELLRTESIGVVQEIDCLIRTPAWTPLRPWTWMDRLATGGGILNNGLTHLLAMLETMLGSRLLSITGEARVLRRRAPVVAPIHDIRRINGHLPKAEDADQYEWRACDAEGAFSALLRFAAPRPQQPPVQVSVVVNMGAYALASTNGWYFYGESGTLIGKGVSSLVIAQDKGPNAEPTPLPIPQRLIDALPALGDDTENKWAALARDFVADVRGESHQPYLTFHDGWRYQVAIDAIRAGQGWCNLADFDADSSI